MVSSNGAALAAPISVIVTILTNGETEVQAPQGVRVEVRHALALGDVDCSCDFPIRRDEYGDWHHIDSPEMWGDDHDAEPDDDNAGTCTTCGHPVYVDGSNVVHVDIEEVVEAEKGRHEAVLIS